MRLKTLLIIYAAIGFVYSLGLLLLPTALLSIYGIRASPATELMARYFGAALAGVTLVAWFARSVADVGALRGITLAFFVSETIAVIVSILGTLSGTMNVVGWAGVALSVALALGFAYFLFLKRTAT